MAEGKCAWRGCAGVCFSLFSGAALNGAAFLHSSANLPAAGSGVSHQCHVYDLTLQIVKWGEPESQGCSVTLQTIGC